MQKEIDEMNRRIEELEQRLKSNEDARKSGQKFVPAESNLKQDFDLLYESIKQMSQVAVEKVNEMMDDFQAIETDVLGPDSVVKAIKDTSGSLCLQEYAASLSTGKWHEVHDTSAVLEPRCVEPDISWPGEGYEINLNVETLIGQQVGEERSVKPLIIAVTPDSKRPAAWSRRSDYFSEQGRGDESETSLRELYYPSERQPKNH